MDSGRVMFCPFCGKHMSRLTRFCFSCGRSLEFLNDMDQTDGPNAQGTSQQPDDAKQTVKPCPSYKHFLEYRSAKSKERQSFNYGPRGKHRAKERKQVQINIGLMVPNGTDGTDLKPLRGKTLPVFVDPEVEAPDVLKQAVQKMRTFNKDMPEGPYVLLYPDCSEVVHVPGSERPFKLSEYKKELGRPYCRITFFICLETHFKGAVDGTSDSDSEIVIASRSTAEFNRADTVVFEPQNQSTPKHKPEDERDAPGHSARIQPGQIVISDTEDMDSPETNPAKTSCYSKYTDLYAPCVEEEDEEVVAVSVENAQHTAVEETKITLPDIMANLSLPIDHKRVSRFNISRANVWDGAVRGFKRKTYSETCDMLVRFTDDAGVFEEGIDTGGPRREFLTLLMKHLKDRPIFDGPEGHRYLVYNANAVREDEYFLAGKMIAVSVVHGGPGPHFLSEDIVHYIAGQPSFKSTVNSITDEEIGKALREIENASSLDALQESIMRHSTMLQTAGCLRHVASVEEKKEIAADYLRWYIIDRNSSVIDRFKDGLSALKFVTALQQHPALLTPVLCHSEKRLSGFELEKLFKPDLSPSGSNRRRKESQTLAYWADYLLDCEGGEAAVSVEDVFMFATGLTSLPPSGLEPSPKIEFLDESPFPMANTCSNLLKLPLLDSYSVFKSKMDFGIQNSPGFGCF
ncbi:G2/M phase-specific E3 ubiquitin-protein ligase-like [Seriola lalandi dorsalis]|uniref:G2/M phase-specific E3 ubiquitin-protein ligase-like n=1 Tax=Seriola lalandi dorsalis TaxID=1841481 RepID=UPI000C6FC8F9|nr:G2/M phase-specific E3 ubiquitin-protein ligase-like [Seriola lalandi dorsalis]